MSKIVPKSMQSQDSQHIKPNQYGNENTENEVMFAALFSGARDEAKPEETLTGKSVMAAKTLFHSDVKSSFDEQTSDDLLALIASFEVDHDPEQKILKPQDGGLGNESDLEQDTKTPSDENSDALALAVGGTLFSETQGGKTALPRSAVAGQANMIFEDQLAPARAKNAVANVASKIAAPLDGNSLLERNKASVERNLPKQMHKNGVKIGEKVAVNKENSAIKNITSDIAQLRALRAANLEQQNADLDKEAAKADLGELNVKSGRNGLTVAGLKKTMASTANPLVTVNAASAGEGVRATNDVTRLAKASSSASDNPSAISGTVANGSSPGQSGGQAGQQGGSQAGAQSGGGFLGNMNNLQILDTAKDNWTEMLLQRVKNGFSGGRDQLNFQLNPRNLGKMRITLVMQNNRTNIQIQTETSAAATMLSDSESRLAQMLEASGLRLGNLNSGQFQGFGGAGSEQQANHQDRNKTDSLSKPDDLQGDGETVEELATEGSDNLINIQA